MRINLASRTGYVRRILVAALFGGFAVGGLHATAPEAKADPLMDCIKAVEELVNGCLGDDAGFFRNYACKWAGGVGYLLCGAGEATKELSKKLPLVM